MSTVFEIHNENGENATNTREGYHVTREAAEVDLAEARKIARGSITLEIVEVVSPAPRGPAALEFLTGPNA